MAENNATFTVRGIESAEDARGIEGELEAVDGVMGASVRGDGGEAEIRYDADLLAEERLKATVREMGYEVD